MLSSFSYTGLTFLCLFLRNVYLGSLSILIGLLLLQVLLLNFWHFCIYSGYSSLGHIFCKYFSLFHRLSLQLHGCLLCSTEAFQFDILPLVQFCFYFLCFGSLVQKTSSPFQYAVAFFSMLSQLYSFWSLIHFDLIFVTSERQESSFILLQMNIPMFQHHILKKLSVLQYML